MLSYLICELSLAFSKIILQFTCLLTYLLTYLLKSHEISRLQESLPDSVVMHTSLLTTSVVSDSELC